MRLKAILAVHAARILVSPVRQPLYLHHIETAGCEGCGMEIAALRSAAFGLPRADIHFVDLPEDAEFLLVTGAISRSLTPVLDAAWEAMRVRRGMIALGACAIDGGPFGENYAVFGGLSGMVQTALDIPGCPPSPDVILDGLRVLAGRG